MEQIGLEAIFNTQAFSSGLNKYTSGLSQAVSDTTSAGGMIGNAIGTGVKIGVEALAALVVASVAAATAISVAILKIANSTGDMAHNMVLDAAKTNLSTTALQEWTYAGMKLGITADDIGMYFFRLSRSAYAASQGTKASVKAFAQLGVNIYDIHGKLKDTNTLFLESIAALGKIKDPTLQDALAMAVFGRSVQDLMPLIKAGTGNLSALTQQAIDMGTVLDDKTIKSFDDWHNSMDEIGASVKGLSSQFVAQFMPSLNHVAEDIKHVLMTLNTKGLAAAIDDLYGFINAGTTSVIVSMSKGLAVFKAKFPTMMKNVVAFLKKSLPTLITFAGAVIQYISYGIEAALPVLIPAAVQIMQTIWKALQDNFGIILQAGKDVLKGLGNGLKAGWNLIKPGLPSVKDILDWIFKTAVGLSQTLLDWAKGVKWSEISASIAAAISGLDWTTYGQEFGQMAKNLWSAISLFLFGGTGPKQFNMSTHQMEDTVVKGVDWGAIGTAVVDALRDGITGALGTNGLGLGDVSNWPDLNNEWADIGTQYGQIVAAGMGPAFWKEYWTEIGAFMNLPALNTWIENLNTTVSDDLDRAITNGLLNAVNTAPARNAAIGAWAQSLVQPLMAAIIDTFTEWVQAGALGPIPEIIATALFDPTKYQVAFDAFKQWFQLSFDVWGPFLSTFWANYFVNPFMQAIALIEIEFIKLLAWYNTNIADPLKLPQLPLPALPTAATSAVIVPPVTTAAQFAAPTGKPAAGNKSITVTINNPSAEPASVSIPSMLTKLNYLGAF